MDQQQAQMTPFEQQLADLVIRFPGAIAQPASGVPSLITVPAVVLPSGWNQTTTTVHFWAPAGFPFANPDCFFADANLRLSGQRLPQNSQVQALPGVGQALWFSWHLNGTWKPNKDTLCTWMAVIAHRFEQRQ